VNDIYKKLKQSMQKYSGSSNMMKDIFGLDEEVNYDLIIVAPSWKPEKIFIDCNCEIKHVKEGPYFNGYLININNKQIGYIQTASGASNVIDCCLTLGHGKCNDILFIGAVGAIKDDIKLGDIIIPQYSISGDGASLYLSDQISTDNFLKLNYPNSELTSYLQEVGEENNINIFRKVVYSTDSIYCEYMHLDEILKMGAEVIEMETAVFFRSMNIISKRGTALLCVSDNSVADIHLVGRTEDETLKYHAARGVHVSKLILGMLVKMDMIY